MRIYTTRHLLAFFYFFVFCVLQNVKGFESWEHRGVGNVAVDAVVHGLQSGQLGKDAPSNSVRFAISTLQQFQTGLIADPKKTKITYGQIVLLVDFMRDNVEMLRRTDAHYGWPTDETNANTRYLQDLEKNRFSYAQASHENHDHFQRRVFHQYWHWHREAVATAANGNLFGALFINAYADHFLQDSFAPGHLISPRDESSHDLYSLLVHDSFNQLGLLYALKIPAECQTAVTLLQPMAPGKYDIALNRQILEGWASNANHVVEAKFHGDNQINCEPLQPIVVAAYCIQSLQDVLDSYFDGARHNLLEDYTWDLHFAGSWRDGQIELIDVRRSFGGLYCKDNTPRDERRIIVGYEDGKLLTASRYEVDSDLITSLSRGAAKNPAFGLSVGAHTFNDSQGNRLSALTEAEMMVAGGRWDYLQDDFRDIHFWRWPNQFALSVGYSGLISPTMEAHGPMTRLVFPIPRMNAQLSLEGGGRYYSSAGTSGWGDFESLRLEWGIQMFNLFFGIGHDHFPRQNGLSDGLSYDAGFSFVFPYSRAKKLFTN